MSITAHPWKIYPVNQIYSGLLYSNVLNPKFRYGFHISFNLSFHGDKIQRVIFVQGREFGLVRTFIAESIPEWISHQKSGFKITMKLPWSWYENDDFLGFVLCSLYVPLEIETTTRRGFNCQLNFDDDTAYFSYESIQFCEFCYDGDALSQGCLIYYPKCRFPKRYYSNEWGTLNASFNASESGTEPVKAARCGFHFLYAHDYEQNNLTIVQRRSKL